MHLRDAARARNIDKTLHQQGAEALHLPFVGDGHGKLAIVAAGQGREPGDADFALGAGHLHRRDIGCIGRIVDAGHLLEQRLGRRAHGVEEAKPTRGRRQGFDEAALELDIGFMDRPDDDPRPVSKYRVMASQRVTGVHRRGQAGWCRHVHVLVRSD